MTAVPTDYRTIQSNGFGDYKDRGSRFLAYIFPLKSEGSVKGLLDSLWADHPKARHICYAYRLGFDGLNQKSSDDGEPSGSAGKPILNQLLSADLTFVLGAVVRYFGGIKLGTSGLIQAYKLSTQAAINSLQIIQLNVNYIIHIDFTYDLLGDVFSILSRYNIKMDLIQYGDPIRLTLSLPVESAEQTMLVLKEYVYQQHHYNLASNQFEVHFSHLE